MEKEGERGEEMNRPETGKRWRLRKRERVGQGSIEQTDPNTMRPRPPPPTLTPGGRCEPRACAVWRTPIRSSADDISRSTAHESTAHKTAG
eukprot:2378321-Pleurochrysis_carterae.AAC.1